MMMTTETDVSTANYSYTPSDISGGPETVFENVFLPLPPLDDAPHEVMEIYGRFMRHVRLSPSPVMDIKVLSAIQFTADMMDMGDDRVAKMLADMGLRCPQTALPQSYLEKIRKDCADQASPACDSSIDMCRFWHDIEEV
jgi:hypothetical protein